MDLVSDEFEKTFSQKNNKIQLINNNKNKSQTSNSLLIKSQQPSPQARIHSTRSSHHAFTSKHNNYHHKHK